MTQVFLDQVAEYASEQIAAAARAWSMGAHPEPVMHKVTAAVGILGMEVPQAFGGQGGMRAKACGADFGFAM